MARLTTGAKALALSILFVLSGPLSQLFHDDSMNLGEDFTIEKLSSNQNSTIVTIPYADSTGIGPSLEMPSDHALQTITFSVEPNNGYRDTGFSWSDWSLPEFQSQGLIEENDGSLILGFQGINYDFDNGTDGWTTSNTNFAQHNTASTCGMSGASGASWWTRGGSVSVTSPVTNLAGFQGLTLNAWIRQGNYGCGEEPDLNEDFYLEYKNANNGWSQIQYLQGSTSGGSVTNVNYNLPANAYHADFQIRARQTQGSGTCCDYWFFDDIVVPGTTGATLTTRSFGWSNLADDRIDEGKYPPIYLDALIPEKSSLNWTVIDADSGIEIPGLVNRTGQWVDLSSVDWNIHDSLRLRLEFSSNLLGESPRLYSISGGGKIQQSFHTDVSDNGWILKNSTWNEDSKRIIGNSNSVITSPVYDIDMPFTAYKFDTPSESNIITSVSIDDGNWMAINQTSAITELDSAASRIQIQYSGSGDWEVDQIGVQLFPSEEVLKPRMDIDSDGLYEWSATGPGIGTWGNQDVFLDGNTSMEFDVGLNPTSWHNLLIPKNAKSFEISVDKISAMGIGAQTVALWIGNNMVSQTGGNGFVNGIRLSLDNTELEDLNFLTASSPVVHSTGGTDFVVGKIETLTDAGKYRLGGLTIAYDAGEVVTATAIDEQVLAMNRARMDVSKSSNLPLLFTASSPCEILVDIITFSSSGNIAMGALTWGNYSQTLTPSENWRELTTRAEIHQSAPHRLILNLYTNSDAAMWFLPILGGSVISTGIDDSLTFENGISQNVSGDIHEIKTRFRLSQHFEDQQYLRLESRIQLANGVVSMPLMETWSSQATDNDMLIQSMQISSERGIVSQNDDYLMAADNLSFEIDIGFESGDLSEKPYPGEYILELLRNDVVIANTSEYEGEIWYVNTTTPFTSGNITYSARLTPLAGGGLGNPSQVDRLFVIDPLSPVVTGANIRHYDHKVSSSAQEIIINITDQPTLPTDVTLMLWTEWANDYNGDGLPSAGEYIPRTLTLPSNLSSPYGSYYTFIDDSSAFPGEKVAGYVIGQDPSGYPVIGGGSEMVEDHLFMYQIMADGFPEIEEDGFQWVDDRRAWLHPGQSYGLNISFTERNGISDLDKIQLMLADNFQSDKLLLIWDSELNNCVSETHHIEIKSCKINDRNGQTPDPYQTELVLNLVIEPQWTLPDLGDFRREPAVLLIDRAGNEDITTFPQNRWRFSSEMMILDNTSLWVENGVLLSDGARVSPGSPMELSGQLTFVRSMETPQFDCEVDTRLNGIKSSALAVNGIFTASMYAPITSGHHALTWNIECMPEQGIDMTSSTTSVKWILVDSVGPQVVEFISPRESSILSVGEHDVRVVISENYGIDSDSVEMIWWVTVQGDNSPITSGSTDLTLDGNDSIGLRLEFVGSIDLSDISPEFLQEQLILKTRFEGRDVAGNAFETSQNSNSYPASSWKLEHYIPDFSIEMSGVELSKSSLEVDEPTVVQIYVRNDGKLGGDAEVLVEVVSLSGERNQLAKSSIYVDAESVGTLVVDWKPNAPGIQRIEVTVGEEVSQSAFVDVKPTQEEAFLEDTLGSTNPWILGITILMLCVGLVFILAWMRTATMRHRESEIDWELDDEELEF